MRKIILKTALLAFAAIVFTACPFNTGYPPNRVYFVKFKDAEYSKYVIGSKNLQGDAYITICQTDIKNQTSWHYYNCGSDEDMRNSCFLGTMEKYIPLHKDYMLCYPYVVQNGMVFDILWEDICTQPLNEVAIKDSFAYVEVWAISESTMCRALGVFKIRNVEQAVKAINKIIDNNKISSVCQSHIRSGVFGRE